MALKELRALQLSNRNAEDAAYYPDPCPDVDLTACPPHARKKTHKDGTPY
jgi:hypothetical protein